MKKLTFSDFQSFASFDENILREIVREGEMEMQARLETANAADQRALTVFGFQTTVLVALVGAIYVMSTEVKPDSYLIFLAVLEVFALAISAFLSLDSVRPKLFAFPGNRPDSWIISDWHIAPQSESSATIKQALTEQCFCLYSCLFDNQAVMEQNAIRLKTSIDTTFFTTTVLALAVCALVGVRLISI